MFARLHCNTQIKHRKDAREPWRREDVQRVVSPAAPHERSRRVFCFDVQWLLLLSHGRDMAGAGESAVRLLLVQLPARAHA